MQTDLPLHFADLASCALPTGRPMTGTVDLRGRYTCTIPEAATVLGIGRDAAYAAARRGEIPTLRVGRRVLVPVPLLLRMLGANREGDAVGSLSERPSGHPKPPDQAAT